MLRESLDLLDNNNAQGEYYLTDTIKILRDKGFKVGAFNGSTIEELMGVNSRLELSKAETLMRKRINEFHLLNGVTIIDPAATYIEADVEIGQDTIVYPGAMIVGDNTTVGPYAYLRPKSNIGNHVKIGDFVEVKNATIEDNSKASHLSYIGDAYVGKDVNIGCGVVFVNYDGKNKFKSVVKDGAFIGSNSNLVAPVTIEEKGYIATGSTITDSVPEGALAIARQRQVVKEGWVSKKEKRDENK